MKNIIVLLIAITGCLYYGVNLIGEKKVNKGKIVKDWKSKKNIVYSEEDLKKKLGHDAFRITQKDGTERSGTSPLDKNYKEGIYIDKVSGEPLYLSIHKFDSGTGWPSFYDSPFQDNLVKNTDYKLLYPRTEIRSKGGDSHLGHLFNDGPKPTGLRYCMNGVALKFIAKEDMIKEGYGEFLPLLKEKK